MSDRVVRVLSGGAAKGVVDAIAPAFGADNGCGIAGTFGAVGAMRELLLGGAPCDVVIFTAALVEALVAEGHVAGPSAVPLGRVETGIAVPDGQPEPDVGDGPALAAAIAAASAIYLPDPQRATAGIHIVDVMKRLGVYDDAVPRLRPHPNGAAAMTAMAKARQARALGCTQITEICYTDGVTLVATLPEGFGLATTYTAAVASRATDPATAGRLVEWLTGPHSRAIRAAGGFRPL